LDTKASVLLLMDLLCRQYPINITNKQQKNSMLNYICAISWNVVLIPLLLTTLGQEFATTKTVCIYLTIFCTLALSVVV